MSSVLADALKIPYIRDFVLETVPDGKTFENLSDEEMHEAYEAIKSAAFYQRVAGVRNIIIAAVVSCIAIPLFADSAVLGFLALSVKCGQNVAIPVTISSLFLSGVSIYLNWNEISDFCVAFIKAPWTNAQNLDIVANHLENKYKHILFPKWIEMQEI